MKYIPILCFIFLFSITTFSQTITTDGFTIKFKKAIKNSKHFEALTSNYYVKASKGNKKIQIRCRVKSISNKREMFDPNKFYLIYEDVKQRIRPADMKYNYMLHGYVSFQKLALHKPYKKRTYWYTYKPEIKDTFKEYTIEGYKDVDNCINFGTKKKPNLKSIYYDHKKIRSTIIDIYFVIPKTFNKGKIYYGNQLIKEFNVK